MWVYSCILWFSLGRAVLIRHPFFDRIVWLVHPRWRRIVAVASVLRGAARIGGPITCLFAVAILDGGWMFLLIARSQDVSSQDSFFFVFSRVGVLVVRT